jgi:acid phosphatase (class A)
MKRISLLVFATFSSLFGCLMVNAQNTVEPYFTADELPNLIKCLPAPPDTMSEHFAHDIMRYIWGKQQRLDENRAAIARRDAVWSYEALFQEFSEPFGLKISREGTPQIWKLLETSLVTTDQMRVEPKKFYNRMRPYVRFNEHILTNGQEEDEVELGKEGSYPSGHTARGWTCALLLAEINPANADTIFARGWMYGESRVIVGAHWQSDVDVTRVAASIGYSRLQTSPAFRAQMALAQEEFRRLTGQTYVPSVMGSATSNHGNGMVYNIIGR